jgi:hypothetical protein
MYVQRLVSIAFLQSQTLVALQRQDEVDPLMTMAYGRSIFNPWRRSGV